MFSLMDMKGQQQRIMNTSGVQQIDQLISQSLVHPNGIGIKKYFFTNTKYRTQFIELLVGILQAKRHSIKSSEGDANTLIVSAALDVSQNNQSVVVVAEDTDIFILLIQHRKPNMADIFISIESKTSSQKKSTELCSIREAHEVIDTVVRQNILFIHA